MPHLTTTIMSLANQFPVGLCDGMHSLRQYLVQFVFFALIYSRTRVVELKTRFRPLVSTRANARVENVERLSVRRCVRLLIVFAYLHDDDEGNDGNGDYGDTVVVEQKSAVKRPSVLGGIAVSQRLLKLDRCKSNFSRDCSKRPLSAAF